MRENNKLPTSMKCGLGIEYYWYMWKMDWTGLDRIHNSGANEKIIERPQGPHSFILVLTDSAIYSLSLLFCSKSSGGLSESNLHWLAYNLFNISGQNVPNSTSMICLNHDTSPHTCTLYGIFTTDYVSVCAVRASASILFLLLFINKCLIRSE